MFSVLLCTSLQKMRLTEIILVVLISEISFGQDKYVGLYNDRFSENIELKTDSTFIHHYRFDLASSWTIGKWKVHNDTIFLNTKLLMDTLQTRNSENKIIRDSLVISADLKPNRIEKVEHLSYLLSSGGQNKVKPPEKMLWKRKKIYRITKEGKVEKIKIVNGDKYKTYFRKQKKPVHNNAYN